MNQRAVLIVIVSVVAFGTAFALSFLMSATGARTGDMRWTYAIIGISFATVAGAVYLGLLNNRTVMTASDASRKAVLASMPPDGRARLLVYRQGFYGKVAGLDILLNGAVVAQLKSPRFVALDVPARTYTIEAGVQGKLHGSLPVALVAGEVAAVRVAMVLGGVKISQEQDLAMVRTKLATMPMVQPDHPRETGVYA